MSTDHGSAGPGRRAIVRWAWRLFRREWRQQLLVLSLMTLAVGAAVAGASMAVNAASTAGRSYATVHVDSPTPIDAATAIAAAKARFGAVDIVSHTSAAVPGSSTRLDLRGEDPAGRFGHTLLALRSGRYPTSASEVALTDGAAELLAAKVGDRVALDRVTRTVVGLVENPSDLGDEFALTPPAPDAPESSLAFLVDRGGINDGGTRGGPAAGSSGLGFRVEAAGTDKTAVEASVLVVTTLAMALVGLIAAGGFVVVAQRRQRQLGLLAAIGATERHLRLVMLANGAIVGAAAALVGAVVGILGWLAAAPAVEAAAGHRIDHLALPWGLILECMVLAVLAATAAAWWPARAIARMPVMAALSRRPARPSPVHRSVALAVGLVAAGVAAIAAAHPTGTHVRPLVLVGGVVAVVIGVVFAAPAAIRVLAAPAGRLPLATRLALRDLARHQARAAAALAAITLALGISVAVVVVAQANVYGSDQGNLSDRQLVIHLATVREVDPSAGPGLRQSPEQVAHLDAAAASVAAAVDQATVLPLDFAIDPAGAAGGPQEPIQLAVQMSPHSFRDAGRAFVATPELLQHLGIDPASIRPSTELLTSQAGKVMLLDMSVRQEPGPTPVQRVALPTYSSAPRALITETAMRAHGWVAMRTSWLVESPKGLTSAQLTAARHEAAATGMEIEARQSQDSLATLRTIATAAGAGLALAIVAMTLGLLRGESAGDLRTLTATGAAAGTRRALTASTAGAMALLGVVLSIAGAYIALVAGYHTQLDKLVPLPFVDLLALAIGLPLVAAAGGWLLAGREPETFSRQALD